MKIQINFSSESKHMPVVYLALAITFEVIGTIALKWSANTNIAWYGAVTVIAYCLSFFCLWLSLKSLPLSLTYATWSGVGIALTAIAGVFLFQEKIDLVGLLGVSLIIIGIVLINGFSTMSGH